MEKMASDSIGKELESNDVLIDVPLVMEPAQWHECCIYGIPKNLRQLNEEAYTPQLVSIGPFHHHLEKLKDMEKHKLRYLMGFFYRTGKSKEDLLKIIEDNEVKIRHSYSETFEYSSKEFMNMILLDAIFIIELFLRTLGDKNDYLLSIPWLETVIIHDLILLENQLPFFVLEKLYMFAFNEEGKQIEEEQTVKHFLVMLFCYYFIGHEQQGRSIIHGAKHEVKHLTDLLRNLFCPPNLEHWSSEEGRPDTGSTVEQRRSTMHDDAVSEFKAVGHQTRNFATKLHELLFKPVYKDYAQYCCTKLDDAGLKFKAAEKRPLLEIKLHENSFRCFDCSCLLACLPCLKFFPCLERMQYILEVPPLKIDDYTEAIFRNLMALEQCHYPSNTYICNYIVLLDCLINTEKDVDLLVDKKIIVNKLGSNTAVADLFNKLGDQIVETRSCYQNIAKKLNEHYEYPLNHILATLKREYFPNIFRGTATVVGLIVLSFTLWNFLKPFGV